MVYVICYIWNSRSVRVFDSCRQKHSDINVQAVIDGGPASEDSRIRVGDQVWKIDGETVSGKPLQLVKSLLRG